MDEKTICFLVGSVSDNLKAKFKIDDSGKWYNERLEAEAGKRSKYTESRRANGSKGGRPKKSESTKKPKAKATKNHMVNHMGNENENENESERLKMQINELGENFSENWERWKAYRKRKDKFTYHDAKSERSAISKLGGLAKGDPDKAIEIINQSIDMGWKGFFNLKTESNEQGNSIKDILAACKVVK